MGTTIVLTTHYLEEAEQLCRNIAIINKGNIIEDTTMKNLLGKIVTQTYILDLKEPCDVVPQIGDFHIRQIDSMTLEADIYGYQNMNDFFTQVNLQKLVIGSVRSKSNRLEELFIDLLNNK